MSDEEMIMANMSSPAAGTFAVFATEDDEFRQLPVVSFTVFEATESEETVALGMVSYRGELLIAEQEFEDLGWEFAGYWVSSCESLEAFLKRRAEEDELGGEDEEEEDDEEDDSDDSDSDDSDSDDSDKEPSEDE